MTVNVEDGVLTPHAGKLGTGSATVNDNKMAATSVRLVAKRYIVRGNPCNNMKVECGSVKDEVQVRG